MKKVLSSIVVALAMLCGIATAQTVVSPLSDRVFSAVTLLYTQDESGGMHMTCTATAYRYTEKTKTYRFASASHCVAGDSDDENAETHFFVTADPTGKTKAFIPAKLLKAGDRFAGDDFSIFEVTPDSPTFAVIPLGDNAALQNGDDVLDVASPLGLGKQFFRGYISAPVLDRPALDAGEVKWKNVMLVQIGGGPGSSGSAIVSVKQQAIVGFLVGGFNSDIGHICIPVAMFKAFEEKVDAGTYKKKPHFTFPSIF